MVLIFFHFYFVRSAIQLSLPEIFYSFQEYLPTLSGRFTTKQFTDRVNSLLLIWLDWAIFPTAFINGLETMLNQTELDLQQFINYIPTEIELSEDIYTLKRHAKFHGISSNLEIYSDKFGNLPEEETINTTERREKYILCRLLACIKNYVKIKENPNEIENSIEEIDGVPVDLETTTTTYNDSVVAVNVGNNVSKVEEQTSFFITGKRDGWVNIEISTEVENEECKSNDDIDGVPLDDFGGDENDDIDGIPLPVGASGSENVYDDDIDGVPLPVDDDDEENVYDDDIDGVPLPNDM